MLSQTIGTREGDTVSVILCYSTQIPFHSMTQFNLIQEVERKKKKKNTDPINTKAENAYF
jgi:hypothetical protein